MILGREPAAILGALQALIALAVGFGLQLTGEQVALIMAAAAAIVALLTRQVSTPINAPRLAIGTVVTAPHGGEPGIVTSTVQ